MKNLHLRAWACLFPLALAAQASPPAGAGMAPPGFLIQGGNASISWDSSSSGPAHLEHSTNLVDWATLSANNTSGSFRHAVGGAARGFYRLRVLPMFARNPVLADSSDTGISMVDGVTQDRTPSFSGSVRGAAGFVQISINGQPSALVPVRNGTWTHTVPATAPLPAGVHTITATPVDSAQTAGSPSQPVFVWVKTAVPAAPTVALGNSSDTGAKGDGVTAEHEPELGGTAPRGARVGVSIDGLPAGLVQSDPQTGAWSFKAPRLANGPHEASVVAIDEAGIQSAPASVAFEVNGLRTVMLDSSARQTIEFRASHILGGGSQGFIVAEVHSGTLEKWVAADNAWVVVPPERLGTAPATLENAPAVRTAAFSDTIRWTPSAAARGMGAAFDVVPLDRAGGATAPVPDPANVPGKISAPRITAKAGVGTTLAWSKPTTGCGCTSTRYSVEVTREDGRTLLYNLPYSVGELAVVEGGRVEAARMWAATKAGAGVAQDYNALRQQEARNRVRFTARSAFSALSLGREARAQAAYSPTGADAVRSFQLGTAHADLAYAEVQAVPDRIEASKGLPADTLPIVAADSNKLTSRQKSELRKYPILARHLFPGTEGGDVQPDHKRVLFQPGEELLFSGNVHPDIRGNATIVVEEAPVFVDGSLGHWHANARIAPAGNGSFSHVHTVDYGMVSVRVRLELPPPAAPAAIRAAAAAPANGVSNTTVPLTYNAFGITTQPWQVANNQGFDGKGNYYNSNYTGGATKDPVDGTSISYNGIEFPLGPVPTSGSQVGGSKGPSNFVRAAGQNITVSPVAGDAKYLYLAGAGANGNQASQTIKLHFTDGTTANWTQSFTDWSNNGAPGTPRPFSGEWVLQTQPERINQEGNLVTTPAYIFGYGYRLGNKTLSSITLPTNPNLGILSAVVSSKPPVSTGQVLGQVNLTGVDMLQLTIRNESNIGAGGGPLGFFFVDQPQDGCDPGTSQNCTYSTLEVVVPMGQQQTITYIAPGNYSQMNQYLQKSNGTCVGSACSTYYTNWASGSGNRDNWASNISPSLNSQMMTGQHWTMTVQNAGLGYWGYLDSPSGTNLPAANGSTPAGAQFQIETNNEIKFQPPWARAVEEVVGEIIGVALLTIATGGADLAVPLAYDLGEEMGVVATEEAEGGGEAVARIAGRESVSVDSVSESLSEISDSESSFGPGDSVSSISRDSIYEIFREPTAEERRLNYETQMRAVIRR